MKTSKNFKYRLKDGSIEITGIIQDRKRLRIPKHIDGLLVTSIGSYAFYNNQLTSVTFPESLTSIGSYAFRSNVILSMGNQNIKMIDGEATILRKKKRKVENFEIYEGKFFNTGNKCYVAQRGEYTAHGDTLKKAIEDVNFKYLQESMEVSEIVNEVKKTQTISISQFRLITGACRTGCKNFLQSRNLTETTELPLKKALIVLKGQFGWDRIKDNFISC